MEPTKWTDHITGIKYWTLPRDYEKKPVLKDIHKKTVSRLKEPRFPAFPLDELSRNLYQGKK